MLVKVTIKLGEEVREREYEIDDQYHKGMTKADRETYLENAISHLIDDEVQVEAKFVKQ